MTKFKVPVLEKGKWYPTEDVAKPAKRAHKPTTAKLRASLKPGTVVILLAGRFKGKRAIVLSQLTSGLLLVTGTYRKKMHGVHAAEKRPARRPSAARRARQWRA